jgi:hypothetical protein
VRPPALTSDLIDAGYSHTELARLTRAGTLLRLRRGAYADPADVEQNDEADRHRLLIAATVPGLAQDAVLSHLSAAVLHQLPRFGSLVQVQVTRGSTTSGKRRGYVHIHAAPLAAGEITYLDGRLVTTLARTVVDLARSLPYAEAVAIGDAALRAGLRPEDLLACLERAVGRPGITQARRVVAFLDPRSETPGESLSRVTLHDLGLDPSHLQYEVYAGERLVGRADFCWEEQRTLGEFDGRVKYGPALANGRSERDVLWAEKWREDAMRDLGWQFVRWGQLDLQRPRILGDRLLRAFARGTR